MLTLSRHSSLSTLPRFACLSACLAKCEQPVSLKKKKRVALSLSSIEHTKCSRPNIQGRRREEEKERKERPRRGGGVCEPPQTIPQSHNGVEAAWQHGSIGMAKCYPRLQGLSTLYSNNAGMAGMAGWYGWTLANISSFGQGLACLPACLQTL
jgi:hypothetical protein